MDDAPLYICVLILYSLPPGTNKIPANPSVVIEDDEIVDLKGSYTYFLLSMYVQFFKACKIHGWYYFLNLIVHM